MVSLSLTLLVRQSLLCPSASTVFCFTSAFPASEITFHISINTEVAIQAFETTLKAIGYV